MCSINRISEFSCIILTFCVLIICSPVYLPAQTKDAQPEDTSKTVVQKVKDFSKKDNFFSRQLKRIIVQDDEPPSATPPDPDNKIIKKFTGKIIREINIYTLDVFGGSVNNPDDSLRSWFQNGGNSLHIKTKDWVIRDKLIFSEGQIFNPFLIQESERILRQSSFIYDARIIPQVIKNNPDSVDILVLIQDVWSINGSASISPRNKTGKVLFKDLNFLGYGNEFKGGVNFSRELTQGWDWESSYTFNNIKKTFLSAKVYYFSNKEHQQYGVSAGRDFFSPVIKWAGGVSQVWENTRYPDLRNTQGQIETVRYNQQDYWTGYAFDLKSIVPTKIDQNKFNIAGRITRTVYSQKPEFDSLDLFQDNTFYLGRIGYSYRIYYTDRYVFGLGRTEDIPLINMIELLIGHEKGSNSSRPYYGLKTGYSFYNRHLGYLYGGFQTGVYRSKKQWQDRKSIIELLYFSDLKVIGKYKWRHYIGTRYSYNYDPIRPQDVLNINNTGGLRGFSDNDLKGNKKLVLNYEANIFVPLKFLGFKLAVITFADFGLIAPNDKIFFDSKLYQGYGIGFRLRNENLIFPAFQFMFAYFPNTLRQGGKHFNMFHQSVIYYRFNQFQFSTPSVVQVE